MRDRDPELVACEFVSADETDRHVGGDRSRGFDDLRRRVGEVERRERIGG